MRKFLVLLRCFHIILCKILLIKLCALKERFSKRHVEDLMQAIPFAAPWHKQQSGTSFDGARSQGAAARPSPSIAPSKMAVSTASSSANEQRATSTTAPTVASAATSSTRSREIVCHKCHRRGHVAAQCPSRRIMIVNEQGEWESKSDREDEDIQEEAENNDGKEIQPNEGDNNCFISLRVLSVTTLKEENG